MENIANRRKSFKFYNVIIFLIGSFLVGGFTVSLTGLFSNSMPPQFVRWLIMLVLFALQMFLYIGNCKYTDLMNFTREFGLYEKKWQFYYFAFTGILYLITFGGLLIFFALSLCSAILSKNLLLAAIVAFMLLIVGIEIIISIIAMVYTSLKTSEILIATRKYGRTAETIAELNRIKIPKLLGKKSIMRTLNTVLINQYTSTGDFKSAFAVLNTPIIWGYDFKLKLFTAIMANNIPEAEKIFAANQNSLTSQAQKDSSAQHILGLWNYIHGDYENSVMWLEKSLEAVQTITFPTFPIYIDLANSHFAAGNTESALQYAEKAEALIENDYDLWRMERFREKYQNQQTVTERN